MSSSLTLLATLAGHTDRVWNVAWDPRGELLATCGGDKKVCLWGKERKLDDDEKEKQPEKWVCKAVLDDVHERTIRRVCWSADGKYIACASFDATCSVWENKNGEFICIANLQGHENEVKSVSFSPSGALLATCSRDKSVWIWEMDQDNEFECLSVLQGHSQDVKNVLWHPTKDLLASASYDDTIKIWLDDEDDWFCAHTLTGHKSTVWDISFNRSGDHIASCSDDNSVIIWRYFPNKEGVVENDVNGKWKNVCTLTGYHSRCIYSVDWNHKNNYIATGASDDHIRIFQQTPTDSSSSVLDSSGLPLTESYECVLSTKAHASDINCVAWNPVKDDILASASDDGEVKIWKFNHDTIKS